MNQGKMDIKVLLGLGLLGIILVYFLASYVVPRTLVTFTKAAPATVVSLVDSRVLGQRILAKADGVDKCTVNVFVMDKTGKGVSGKSVSLTGAEGIDPQAAVTDTNGKAMFNIVSKTEGQFKLEAAVEGAQLDRTVTVTFRN